MQMGDTRAAGSMLCVLILRCTVSPELLPDSGLLFQDVVASHVAHGRWTQLAELPDAHGGGTQLAELPELPIRTQNHLGAIFS